MIASAVNQDREVPELTRDLAAGAGGGTRSA